MSLGRFHKMHGLGNDFVVIDGCGAPVPMTPARAAAIADRHSGIGCDQLILIEPSNVADVAMRIYNSDGSAVEACGNASRCVVALIGHDIAIETVGGVIRGEIGANDVTIDMGAPRFGWDEIPLAYPIDTRAMPVSWHGLPAPDAVNVGNPHVIFFVDDSAAIPLAEIGPDIEHDAIFPDRINVNIASISDGVIDLRVWERGVGETRACGTGACATAVAAIRRKLVASPVTVRLPGGSLTIAWQEGFSIRMTGPATHVFEGQADWSLFG